MTKRGEEVELPSAMYADLVARPKAQERLKRETIYHLKRIVRLRAAKAKGRGGFVNWCWRSYGDDDAQVQLVTHGLGLPSLDWRWCELVAGGHEEGAELFASLHPRWMAIAEREVADEIAQKGKTHEQ